MKRITALFTALALVLGLCACKSTADRWQEQYDLGIRYLSEGNYEEAIIAFTAAIEIDPKQAAAFVGRGDAYVGYAQQLTADSPDGSVLSDKAQEAYTKAIQDYLAAIDLDGSDASVYQKAADTYVVLGNAGSASSILERGLQTTQDQALQTALDELDGIIIPEELIQGSELWTALEDFLAYFGWYGDYDCETAVERTARSEWVEPSSAMERFLSVAGCYSYNDSLYPGEAMQVIWDGFDPLGKWADGLGSYIKVNAAKLEWIMRHIFNCSPADIGTMKRQILADVNEYIYYLDGYYYFAIGGIGGGYDASIKSIEQIGVRYIVDYDTYTYDMPEARRAVVALKEIDGREYWTLYEDRALEYSEMDWQDQYRKFVYDGTYLEYEHFFRPGYDEGWTDYVPITFSLRDISGDGNPELIIYNGCDYEAEALYYVFTSEASGVRYVGTAGFRIGWFSYSENPRYPGLFYMNGNWGYFRGHYYYMENGEMIDEQVLTKEDEYFIDGSDEYVTTQVTSDDALFDEFQNGNHHGLATYSMDDIYTIGWDTFVQETGGQTWP